MNVAKRIIKNTVYVAYGILLQKEISKKDIANIVITLICCIVVITVDCYVEYRLYKNKTNEIKESKWVRSNPFTDTLECKNCRFNICDEELKSDYCPNCGAKMKNPYEL